MHMMGVGHVTQHEAWHGCDEMLAISPELGGLRDMGTEGRTSHNMGPMKAH